jgi:hypothetical protein
MRRDRPPEALPEAEIARRLYAIYTLMGWPLPVQQQKDDRVPGPEKLRDTAAERKQVA